MTFLRLLIDNLKNVLQETMQRTKIAELNNNMALSCDNF